MNNSKMKKTRLEEITEEVNAMMRCEKEQIIEPAVLVLNKTSKLP